MASDENVLEYFVGFGIRKSISADRPVNRAAVLDGDRSDADVAMDRYANGDDGAFGDVYDAVAPRLLAYLRRQTRNDTRAEDLTQQAFLHIHRARGTFIAGSAVVPWAFAIARRLLIDEIRRGKRDAIAASNDAFEETMLPILDATSDCLIEARELATRLQKQLSRLPENQRVAFELMRFDGLSHNDAASTLGITVTALKLRVHRAYEALRTVLEDGMSAAADQ